MPELTERKYLLKREQDGVLEACSSPFHKALVKKIQATCSATAGIQTAHAHGLGITPTVDMILFVTTGNFAGNAYLSASPDATSIHLKATVSSLTVTIWIIYEV